jgi:threonine synthase
MKYQSTRGYNQQQSFSDILLEGLAPDGGLYMPLHYPNIAHQLQQWQHLSYADLSFEILKLFCDEQAIPHNDLKGICHKTYTLDVYCHARHTHKDNIHKDITPLNVLDEDMALLELSNGPTLAFKDMAMQLIGNLFEYVLHKNKQQLNILGATSGDTGSAAEYAMLGKENIRVFMLSPHQKMSTFQQAQMFSLQHKNIFNIAIEGFFDNCQDIVKAVSHDLHFKQNNAIGTVNSINWARIAAQVIYYVKGYFNAIHAYNLNIGDKISFCVPSGNFGNICAGHIARQMGLPIAQLVVATNENNVLDNVFKTGVYQARSTKQTQQTSSPSMDISKASNFERFVFDYYAQNAQLTQQQFTLFNQQHYIDFTQDNAHCMKIFKNTFGFVSACANHAHRLDIIRDVYARYNVIIDPHTADGVKAARSYIQKGIPMIVLETAQPVKFEATIKEALGFIPQRPLAFKDIEQLPKHVQVMADDVNAIKKFIMSHISS